MSRRVIQLGPIRAGRARGTSLGLAVLLALPAVLTVLFGFSSGGYFPGATGLAAVVLAGALALRVTLAPRPFSGVSLAVLVAASALALYAIWTLASAQWSGSPARALLEFDRALLYLLALVVLGSVPMTGKRLEWALRAFTAAVVVVCLAGLVSRVAPDVLSVSRSAANDRLSYPVSYWNALGLLAVIGLTACLHLASGPRQPRLARALGAAAIPPLAATLLLTFSRGAILVGLLALLLYLMLARPWGILATAAVVGPAAGLSVVATYNAKLLATTEPTTAAAIGQGHRLAGMLVLCTLGAGLLRALLAGVDARLERRGERRRAEARGGHAPVRLAAAGAAAVVLVLLLVVLDLPGFVDREYKRFVAGDVVAPGDVRERLTKAGNNGRVENWSVALEGFSVAPWIGQGAGSYQNLWAQGRGADFNVIDGHSLYLEVLAELGVVGLTLLAMTLLTLVSALAARARGRDRSLYAAVLAAVLAWAVHAGVDWHWEMPAVTTWVFALGGLAVAAPACEPGGAWSPAPLTRIVAALGCLLLAVTPALAALSQRALDESVAAYRRGECTPTADAALASISYLSARPQPFELLAYCNVRVGLSELAVRSMGRALARDPANWEYHYGLALIRGAAGLDPRREAAIALVLNPLSPLTREAVIELGTADTPRQWRRRALEARLPLAP